MLHVKPFLNLVKATFTRRLPEALKGTYMGRVLVRASGSFDIRTKHGRVQGISHRFCTLIHRSDGYSYKQGAGHAAHTTRPTS